MLSGDHADGPRPRREGRRPASLDEAIVAYCQAVDAGLAPDPVAWAAAFPEFAAGLRAFWADEQQFRARISGLRALNP